MKCIVRCPEWGLKMFAHLCFCHVKEQLSVSLMTIPSNPASFVCNGQLYVVVSNSFLIRKEPELAEELLCN